MNVFIQNKKETKLIFSCLRVLHSFVLTRGIHLLPLKFTPSYLFLYWTSLTFELGLIFLTYI